MDDVLEKFLRYVRVDTPSDADNGDEMPSSACQADLAALLVEELKAMGVEDVETDANGYVYAWLESNCASDARLGLIAHMDTVSEPKATGVNPQVTKNYNGKDIVLPSGTVISPDEFPEMRRYKGQDIVTSDGATILGADDKAGVAEIMAAVQYMCEHPEFEHGRIGIAFTPDEEIGNGASRFDVGRFGCDFAYTVDGEEIGEISYETFNGAAFTFTVTGHNIHPGSAKGKMVNSILIADEIIRSFPEGERPETTEGRQGYYFVDRVAGSVEETRVEGIVRDHDRDIFEVRKARVKKIADDMDGRYPGRVSLEMHDQYYNCGEKIRPCYHLVENAAAATEDVGETVKIVAVRGGTDGSGLSFKGLPCPNLGTGGHNAHGVQEFVPVQSMEKVVDILLGIISRYSSYEV